MCGLLACADKGGQAESEVAARIKQTFENNMYQLPPRVQGHYAVRLYRLTGDNKYLYPSLYDYYIINDRINTFSANIQTPGYINQRAFALSAALGKGIRGKARRHALKSFPQFIFYATELLNYSARLNEFGVKVPQPALRALNNYDFLPGLTDKTMIRAWAAQLANYVYWLRKLGIADHTEAFKTAFFKAYPDSEDRNLSRWHLRNKLYGLTHFVFAASDYYQHHVSVDEFGWVLSYFEQNQSLVMKNATDDIAAEIGLCFLLMKKNSHPLVKLTKAQMVNSFNTKFGMIPSVSGKIDLATAEHRNVLAYMLLAWPARLHPGPLFHNIEHIRQYLPINQQ